MAISAPGRAMNGDPVSGLPYARGAEPTATAMLRATPDDFRVVERLDFPLEGRGPHLWLWVEKREWNTVEVASRLAAHFGVLTRDVGFAGLKDRHAVTRQWFSVPTPRSAGGLPRLSGIQWLAAVPHRRKLQRGAHRSNRFRIRLRDVHGSSTALEADLERIRTQGVPNYFGSQRFGRGGRNLEHARALFAGRRLKRPLRSLALSAARAQAFNAVLAQRVWDGTWCRVIPGEAVALAGSDRTFPYSDGGPVKEMNERLARWDVHPSGPLPGAGESPVAGEALQLERSVLDAYQDWEQGLCRFGVKQARRPLRLCAQGLQWRWLARDVLELEFELVRGAFATAVIREFVDTGA